MQRFIIATAIALATCPSANADDQFALKTGRLSLQGNIATQVVEVQNNTSQQIRGVRVSCGFFDGQHLITEASGSVENLSPGDTGFANVIAFDAPGARSARCRITQTR